MNKDPASAPCALQADPQLILLWVTMPDKKQAEDLARDLIEQGLAACVNIIPGMRSCFSWQGAVCLEEEVGLLVKTAAHQQQSCQQRIIALHPYDIPCVVELAVTSAHQPFVAWVATQTASGHAGQ